MKIKLTAVVAAVLMIVHSFMPVLAVKQGSGEASHADRICETLHTEEACAEDEHLHHPVHTEEGHIPCRASGCSEGEMQTVETVTELPDGTTEVTVTFERSTYPEYGLSLFPAQQKGSDAVYIDSYKSEIDGLALRVYETCENNIDLMRTNPTGGNFHRIYVNLSGLGSIKFNAEFTMNVSKGLYAFEYDHTEYFWLSTGGYEYTYNSSGTVLELKVVASHYEDFPTFDDIIAAEIIFNDTIDEVLAGMDGMNTFEKIFYLNSYLIDNCEYNPYVASGNTDGVNLGRMPWCAYSAVVHQTEPEKYPVCQAYSHALKALCSRAGINCALIRSSAINHMWNAVQMEDGLWYYIDATWNDSEGQIKYFLRGTSMNVSHKPSDLLDGNLPYPEISKDEYHGHDEITLCGDHIVTGNHDCSIYGKRSIRVTSGRTYYISGKLDNGCIYSYEGGSTKLVLSDTDISCTYYAPICFYADDLRLELHGDNRITVPDSADGESVYSAVYARGNLTTDGTGALTVYAGNAKGIYAKGDISILGGTVDVTSIAGEGISGYGTVTTDGESTAVTVNSSSVGIYASEGLSIQSGIVDVASDAEGIYSGAGLGISGENTAVTVNSNSYGIYAEDSLNIHGGKVDVTSTAGEGIFCCGTAAIDAENTAVTVNSSGSGIYTYEDLSFHGGTVNITSAADGMHSRAAIGIDGENTAVTLNTSGIGIFARSDIRISGGTTDVTSDAEGIFSRTKLETDGDNTAVTVFSGDTGIYAYEALNIHGGTVNVTSTDDVGIKGYLSTAIDGENTTVTVNAGSTGIYTSDTLNISGGMLRIKADTGGIICKDMTVKGGTVYINSEDKSDESSVISYWGDFNITGGLLIAFGRAKNQTSPYITGCPNNPGIGTLVLGFRDEQSAGREFVITDAQDNTIAAAVPEADYSAALVCSAGIEMNTEYRLYTDSELSGEFTTSASGYVTEISIPVPAPTPTPTATPTPTLTSEPTPTPTSEPTPTPTSEPTAEPTTEPEHPTGDLNGDGKINTADAVIILKVAAGMIQLDENQNVAGDCNHDDKVNTADAVLILKYAAGMISAF